MLRNDDLEFKRTGNWISCDSLLPSETGWYLVKIYVDLIGEVECASLLFDAEDKCWKCCMDFTYSVISWNHYPYPYQGTRAPGYCS